jgi:hypothetical protein
VRLGGLAVAIVLACSTAAAGQAVSCRQRLETWTVCQRCYQALGSAPFADGRVFVYVPDIKSGFLSGFTPFKIWIVEGLYGKPFIKGSGAMDERTWEQIRTSRNVRATPVDVPESYAGNTTPFRISKETFVLEIVKVITSWGGTDRVTIRVCR